MGEVRSRLHSVLKGDMLRPRNDHVMPAHVTCSRSLIVQLSLPLFRLLSISVVGVGLLHTTDKLLPTRYLLPCTMHAAVQYLLQYLLGTYLDSRYFIQKTVYFLDLHSSHLLTNQLHVPLPDLYQSRYFNYGPSISPFIALGLSYSVQTTFTNAFSVFADGSPSSNFTCNLHCPRTGFDSLPDSFLLVLSSAYVFSRRICSCVGE